MLLSIENNGNSMFVYIVCIYKCEPVTMYPIIEKGIPYIVIIDM